jgi:hypothetical protein
MFGLPGLGCLHHVYFVSFGIFATVTERHIVEFVVIALDSHSFEVPQSIP